MMSLTFQTCIWYMPTTFNQRFQHEVKCCKIFALFTDDEQKQHRLFMCKDLGHKGQTLLLQNLPIPTDTNPVKGMKIQEYHVIQAESQLVLDSIT